MSTSILDRERQYAYLYLKKKVKNYKFNGNTTSNLMKNKTPVK